MGRATGIPRRAGPGSSNLYQPCVTCTKPRTLCIRIRRPTARPWDFGHANLAILEEGQPTVTYGNWPGTQNGSNINDIRRNDPGDDPAKDSRFRKEDVKCKQLTPEEEKKLEEAINKKQQYGVTDNNCARWAGTTWNNVTGDSLNYGATTNTLYNSPTTLLESMNPQPTPSIPGGVP